MIGSEARRSHEVPLLVAAVLSVGLAVLLESQLRVPVRLTGHRAFPGALALLLLAETAPGAALIGFAAAIGAGVALLAGSPLLVVVWVVPAAILVVAQGRPWSRSAWFLVGMGVLFGALRALSIAPHHAPQLVRLAGHLAFGALGALGAVLVLPRPRGARDVASR